MQTFCAKCKCPMNPRKLSASESDSSDSDDQSDDGSSSGDESTSGSTSEGEKGLEKQRHEHKKLSTKTEAGLMKQKIVSRSKKVFAKQPSLSSESSDDQEQDSSKRKMKNSRKKNLSVNNGSNSSAEEKSHTEHRKRKRRRADSDSLDEKKLPKQEKDYIQRQQKVVHNLDGDRTKKYDDRNRRYSNKLNHLLKQTEIKTCKRNCYVDKCFNKNFFSINYSQGSQLFIAKTCITSHYKHIFKDKI